MKPSEVIATTIYTETAAMYAQILAQLNDAALGYKVLYGRPWCARRCFSSVTIATGVVGVYPVTGTQCLAEAKSVPSSVPNRRLAPVSLHDA
jgi:hypothetical protein